MDKGIAITIATDLGSAKSAEDESMEMFEDYAKSIIDGIKREDAKQTTYALKKFIKLCEATDYEGEESEDDEFLKLY